MPVTRIEIEERGVFAAGRPFGDYGAYEYVGGVLHFASDPARPEHQVICDIGLAPTNARGQVEYRAQFHLLKPVQPPAGGRLLVDSINRGQMTALSTFNNAVRRTTSTPDVDPGNGHLMRQGYSVLSVGLQWDVPDSPERMRAWFPEAIENGERLRGTNFVQWWPARKTSTQLLSDAGHKPYPCADLDDRTAMLTVRDHHDAEPRVIPREQWRFAREVDGKPQPSDQHVYLEGGFQPGFVYEITYTAIGAPIIGLGFLAYRDAASLLKYGSEAEGNPLAGSIDRAYGWGVSMNGRWLREFLYLGLNRDEAGRQVLDGVFAHTGSSRRGEFNLRFGQPSTNILRAPGNIYPFAWEPTPEPELEEKRGLLDRSRANDCMPKVVQVNSGVEYWWSGASLSHTTVDASRDFDPPEDVRLYYLSGTQHGPGGMPASDRSIDGFQTRMPMNTVDYRPVMRAVLAALDRWVREGIEPPATRVPRLDNATAVPRESLRDAFLAIPGVSFPEHLPRRLRLDYGPAVERGVVEQPPVERGAYPTLVSAVDEDRNEVAGVRLPDVAVPLATYTGWNVRDASMGGGGLMTSSAGAPLAGSTIIFPRTEAERRSSGDPRRSIEERYASRDAYLAQVRACLADLEANGLVLAEDIDPCLQVAAEKWDAFRGPV